MSNLFFLLHFFIYSGQPFAIYHCFLDFIYVYIWHKSARIGEILNPCHNLKLLLQCAQNGPWKEFSLLFQITTVGGSPKDHT